jgi:RHS repeat-associated protein
MITQYNGDGTKVLPATRFTYYEDGPAAIGWTSVGSQIPVSFLWKNSTANGRDAQDFGVQLVDVNRDALPDVVQAYDPNDATGPEDSLRQVFLNVGGEWASTPSTVWVPPADTVVHDLGRQEYDNGVRFVDLNGDKLVDVVMYALVGESGSPITGVWLNSVNGWGPQEPQGAWSLPEAFSRINPTGEEAGKIGVDRGVRFGDVNGDGLVDLVLGRDGAGGHHGHVYLNTGNAGWTDTNSSSWIVPQSFIYQYDGRSTADLGTRLIDVNGDGLADLVRSNVSVLSSLEAVGVWINRGTPDALGNLWVQDPEYEIPEYFTFVDVELPFIGGSDDSDDLGVRFADVNGDGKVDLIVARRWEGTSTSCGFGSNTCQAIYLQTADKKWVFDAGWSETIPATYFFIEHRAGAEDYDDGVRLADIDGNGTVDLLKSMAGEGADNDGRQNHDELSELLKRVELPVGGTSEFVYQSSAYYPNGLPGEPVGTSAGFLPYTIPVVSESTISDGGSGLGHSYTSRYAYGQGFYHTKRREFRGFRVVRTEMPGGMAYTQRILAQERDLDFAPLVGAVEWEYTRRSSDDSLYSVKERRFDRSDSAPPRFHWMEFEDEYLFDWSTSAAMEDVNLSMAEKRVSTAHVYAFEQNLGPYFAFAIWHETQTLGDEATPSDDSFTREDYTNDQAKWWIGVPKHRIMTDAPGMTGNRLQEEWLYYDDYNDSLSHGVIGVAGNLSKAEAWSGESGDGMGAANNRTELKHFDVYGNVTQSVDGDGHSVNLSYGGVERTKTLPDEIHIETGLGGGLVTHQETYAYDHRFGLPLVVTRPGQVTLQASYDSFGRLEKAWMPLDSPSTPTTCVQYDVTSRPIVVKRFRRENSGAGETCGPVGMLAETEFIDGLGRTIEKKAEGGGPAYLSTVVQATSFDERGLPAKEYRAFFSGSAFDVYHSPTGSPGIAYQYDALGRKTRVTPDGLPSIERTYDGWTTARRDSENRLTASDVDAFGRVIQYRTYDENEAIYATTSVEYDPLGRLMKVRDTLGNEWEYTYNPFGQRLTTNDPDAGGTTTRYNKDGTVKETIDAFNRTTTYEYDALHRLRFKYRADGSHVENRYDEASGGPGGRGWLTSSVDSATGISEAYVYDLLGRVTTQRLFADGPVQDEIVRQYDAMDRVVSIRYPENTTITYGFGTDGRVNAINGYVDLVRYTPTGALKSYQLHNGVSVTNTYNPTTNRLESRTAARPVGLPVQSLSYQYKPTGYLESITDLVGTASQVFTLDHQYRLKQAVGGYGNKQYDYDVLGNMTLKENVSFTRSPTKPHQILTGSGGRTFTYYEDGSLWTATSAEEEWEYTYDLDGRLRLATEELAGVEAEFVYAPGGGRAKKIESTGNGPSTTTIQMGDLYQKVGGNEKIFIYLGSERIAEVNSSSTRFMLSDHTNSTSVVTDSVGVVEQRTEYRPYGEVSSLQGDGLSLDFGFAGARREPNLGLSDFGARFYSPSLGRFLNVDSLFSPEGHPGSLNRYGYGLGNPVSFTDIGGLFAFPLFWVYEAFGTSGVDSGMVQNPYPIGAVRDVEQWQTCCSTQVGVSSPPTPAWPIGILLADSGTGPAVAQSQDGISELKIVTEIRPPDAQEGMKSTQIVRVDRRTGELSEWHWTGRTWVPFFGQVISSRGDAFTAEVSGPEDALTVKMTGETASRLWWSKINYTFVLGFDSSSGTWAAIGGAHDGYPSYVVTADGLVIYNFSQGSIWDLNGCCDVEVGR